MKVNIRSDCVEIEGYVNAIERNSKPLWSRAGEFVERVCKGAFTRALRRAKDVHILLNHNWDKDLGSIDGGNLELYEDSIGLYARATITDADVIEDARSGKLVGWSFGFMDVPNGVERAIDGDTKLPLRKVKDLDLREVSILNTLRSPAYEGTLVTVRSEDGETMLHGEENIEEVRTIDYSKYEDMISEMKSKNTEIE